VRYSLLRLARRLWLSSAAAWTEYAILQWPLDGLAWFRAWFGRWSGQAIRRLGPARAALLATVDLAIIAVAVAALAKAFGR
jgi:hypothetical protein